MSDAIPCRAAKKARYPTDPWTHGFCVGYLLVDRVARILGVSLDRAR
jgi:hypothetical protein